MVESSPKRLENTVGKGETAFNRLALQTCKNQGLFGKRLRMVCENRPITLSRSEYLGHSKEQA